MTNVVQTLADQLELLMQTLAEEPYLDENNEDVISQSLTDLIVPLDNTGTLFLLFDQIHQHVVLLTYDE